MLNSINDANLRDALCQKHSRYVYEKACHIRQFREDHDGVVAVDILGAEHEQDDESERRLWPSHAPPRRTLVTEVEPHQTETQESTTALPHKDLLSMLIVEMVGLQVYTYTRMILHCY